MTSRTISMGGRPRILVARTDRIGDVVLSLPVFASLRNAYPDAYICALTREYTRGLLEDRDDVDDVIAFDAPAAHVPFNALFGLASRIKERKFDVAVALYMNFSVGLALALAGVPRRIGPATKLAQLLLTDRIRQRRSKTTRHEADHNLDLLEPLGVEPVRAASIIVPPGGQPLLAKTGGRPLIGVHPGHGGSSRNWPEANYAELAASLVASGCDVVITGAPHERELAERTAKEAGDNVRVYIGDAGLKQLARALSELDAFVSSSTGPLHIASAAGAPVVGIYCPIFVCLPARWGPIGPNDTALAPPVEPCEKCVFDECPHYDCMAAITVGQVKTAVLGKVRTPARI